MRFSVKVPADHRLNLILRLRAPLHYHQLLSGRNHILCQQEEEQQKYAAHTDQQILGHPAANPRGDRPENEGGISHILHGGTETDNGQRAHHTQ